MQCIHFVENGFFFTPKKIHEVQVAHNNVEILLDEYTSKPNFLCWFIFFLNAKDMVMCGHELHLDDIVGVNVFML
jgi:hypothetical protein